MRPALAACGLQGDGSGGEDDCGQGAGSGSPSLCDPRALVKAAVCVAC